MKIFEDIVFFFRTLTLNPIKRTLSEIAQTKQKIDEHESRARQAMSTAATPPDNDYLYKLDWNMCILTMECSILLGMMGCLLVSPHQVEALEKEAKDLSQMCKRCISTIEELRKTFPNYLPKQPPAEEAKAALA